MRPIRDLPYDGKVTGGIFRSRAGKKFALALMVLGLAGCAVAPAPFAPRLPGQTTGYTDRQLTATRWRITFTGNSVTPREQVEDDLLLRSAQVALAAGYSHFLFDTRNTTAQTRYQSFGDPFYRDGFGGIGYWGFRPRFGYDPFGPDVDIISTTRYQAYAEIVLLNDATAAKEPRSVDARQVVQHLAPPAPTAQSPA